MDVNYLAALCPTSPMLALLVLGSGEAVKRLCHCGQRISAWKN
jgi:hypothetical protein